MMRRTVTMLGMILAVGAMALFQAEAQEQAAPTTIGAGVSVPEATAIADLYARPAAFVGTRVRIDGVVTAVCDAMGCWMALAPDGQPERTVRLKAEHDGGLVFPTSARGRQASAEGVFERIASGDIEASNAASEQAEATGSSSSFIATYHIKATGAVIR